MNDKKPNNQKKPSLPRNPFFMFLLLSIVFTVLLNSLLSYLLSPQEKEIYYSEFIQMVENDEVEEVQLSAEKIVIYKKE